MKKIFVLALMSILLGALTWLTNWLTNGNGYVTYAPVTVGGNIVGYIDHVFDPLLYFALIVLAYYGFVAKTGSDFITMCAVLPQLFGIFLTFVGGWFIGLSSFAFMAMILWPLGLLIYSCIRLFNKWFQNLGAN